MVTAKQRNELHTFSTALEVLNVFCVLKKKRKRKEKKREKEEKLLSYALGSGETKDKVFFMVVILILCYSVFSEF